MAFDASPDPTETFAPVAPLDNRYAVAVRHELKRTAYVEELRSLFANSGRHVDATVLRVCAGRLLGFGWEHAADNAFADGAVYVGATLALAGELRAEAAHHFDFGVAA